MQHDHQLAETCAYKNLQMEHVSPFTSWLFGSEEPSQHFSSLTSSVATMTPSDQYAFEYGRLFADGEICGDAAAADCGVQFFSGVDKNLMQFEPSQESNFTASSLSMNSCELTGPLTGDFLLDLEREIKHSAAFYCHQQSNNTSNDYFCYKSAGEGFNGDKNYPDQNSVTELSNNADFRQTNSQDRKFIDQRPTRSSPTDATAGSTSNSSINSAATASEERKQKHKDQDRKWRASLKICHDALKSIFLRGENETSTRKFSKMKMLEESVEHMRILENAIRAIAEHDSSKSLSIDSLRNEFLNEAKSNELGLNLVKAYFEKPKNSLNTQAISHENAPLLSLADNSVEEIFAERERIVNLKRSMYTTRRTAIPTTVSNSSQIPSPAPLYRDYSEAKCTTSPSTSSCYGEYHHLAGACAEAEDETTEEHSNFAAGAACCFDELPVASPDRQLFEYDKENNRPSVELGFENNPLEFVKKFELLCEDGNENHRTDSKNSKTPTKNSTSKPHEPASSYETRNRARRVFTGEDILGKIDTSRISKKISF